MENIYIQKIERQEMILREINNATRAINKRELSEKLGVTDRTIIRDIKNIIQENNDILIIRGRNGGYKKIKGDDNNRYIRKYIKNGNIITK